MARIAVGAPGNRRDRRMTSAAAAGVSLDVGAISEQVREAHRRAAPLRIAAAGTWLDAGRPAGGDPLSLGGLRGIVDYVPGDLTLTARAGTPLSELERATAAEGQWIPLDPFGSGEGTLGATIATASAGPLAHAFGSPRDNVLGVELVLGNGEVIRAGGRVVKNVAGYDLTRLSIGAWGTLGVITEASIRLRALPVAETTIAMHLPADPAAASTMLTAVRRTPLTALALEALGGATAAALGLERNAVLLVRLGGNEDAVAAQLRSLRQLGDTAQVTRDVWTALRAIEPRDAQVVRLSSAPADFAGLWSRANTAADALRHALVHGSPMRGILRFIAPPDSREELVSAVRSIAAPSLVGERLAAATWPELCPSPVTGRLARGVRSAFDPMRILNRGILGEPDA